MLDIFFCSQKILKANYTKSDNKIHNHDESVKKNWIQFKKGEIELPPHLSEHLKKFTSRDLNPKPFNLPDQTTEKIRPDMKGEFSEIISSYQKITNKNNETRKVDKKQKQINKELKDTYILDDANINNNQQVTLTALKKNIETKAIQGKKLTEDDQIILSEIHKEKDVICEENPILTLDPIKFKQQAMNKQLTVTKKSKDSSHLIYPEKIVIPKDKLKRGYTYKLNDCYYGSDGTFLYRVPGMDS